MRHSHNTKKNQTDVACYVSVADGEVASPIILGQRHSEVGWPVPFLAAVRFPVIDRYPLRLGEPGSGQPGPGIEPRTLRIAVRRATA